MHRPHDGAVDFTAKKRDALTPGDTICNYAMLLDWFNEQGRMKLFGLEKHGWYGSRWSAAARAAMQHRAGNSIVVRGLPARKNGLASKSYYSIGMTSVPRSIVP